MRKYSIGVFLNIFDSNRTAWEKDRTFIRRLGGVEHIELLFEYLPKKDELRFFKELSKEFSLIIHAPFMDLSLLSPHPEIVLASSGVLKRTYQIGNEINAKAVTVHAGSIPMFWEEREAFGKLKKQLSVITSNRNIPVGVENLKQKTSVQIPFPYSFKQYKKISTFSHLTLDVGHFMSGSVDPLFAFERLYKKIIDIHLHDFRDGKDHLPLGEGELGLEKLLSTFEKKRYDKFLTLEVIGRPAIRKSWNVLRRFF